jgi:hypothetical protein
VCLVDKNLSMDAGRGAERMIGSGRRRGPSGRPEASGKVWEAVVPNPKLKLMDQIREVMRLKHYSIRTERSYCDWVRRFVKFHHMRSLEG